MRARIEILEYKPLCIQLGCVKKLDMANREKSTFQLIWSESVICLYFMPILSQSYSL